MNIVQRIVLIMGALIIVAILLFTPYVKYIKGKIVYAEIIDWQTIAVSSVVVISATFLIWFACKK